MTEKDTIRAAQSGDENAYCILVEDHQTRIFNLLIGMLHNVDAADELTQETFIRAWRALSSFRMHSSLWTWLYRIAYRLGLDYLQSLRHSPVALSEEVVSDALGDGPYEAAVKKDRLHALSGALQELSVDQRTAIILYYFHGLSYQEIAEVTKRRLGTIRTDLHRGKEQLRNILLQRWGMDETDQE